jgi:CheY-like chemotaxis protein
MWPDERSRSTVERARVLVVDDDALAGALIGDALEEYRVTFVQSAAGAIGRIVAGGTFGAVVCDLVMPGMSGPQFHSELARIAPDLARRIVFLSASASSSEVEVFTRRVGLRCLPKPFNAAALQAAVEEVARR